MSERDAPNIKDIIDAVELELKDVLRSYDISDEVIDNDIELWNAAKVITNFVRATLQGQDNGR